MDKKIAIVGSGISGLAAAHALKDYAQITLYEAGNYFGGHTNTVEVTLPTKIGGASRFKTNSPTAAFNFRGACGLA